MREFLEYQILSDFIITNTDRHFNNFGVLRDSATLKFSGMAPIFDSGNSLFWNCPRPPLKGDLLDIPVRSFCKKETGLLRYVSNAACLDIQKLPPEDEIRELLRQDIDYGNRADAIIMGYHKKIQLLQDFQDGKKIYSPLPGLQEGIFPLCLFIVWVILQVGFHFLLG